MSNDANTLMVAAAAAQRLRKGRSTLLIVDLQERLMPVIVDAGPIAERARRLIVAAKQLAIPVYLTEQVPEKLGPTVPRVREAFDAPASLAKATFSACPPTGPDTQLTATLRSLHRQQIVIAGVEAHVCVLQTALDLISGGFSVFIVEDAVGSRDPLHKTNALRRIERAGGVIVNHESALFEWLETAAAPEFRELSRLVK